MVVPDSESVAQQLDDSVGAGARQEDQQNGQELEEVRKLRELVQRLELQNESLRNRGSTKPSLCANTIENVEERTLCEGRSTVLIQDTENETGGDFQTSSLPHGSSTSEDASPLHETPRPEDEGLDPAQAGTLDRCDIEPGGRSDVSMDQSALDEVDVLNLDDCADLEDEDSW